jgi:hypothetical protein
MPRALIEVAALARRRRETGVLTSPPAAFRRVPFPPVARFGRGAGRRNHDTT